MSMVFSVTMLVLTVNKFEISTGKKSSFLDGSSSGIFGSGSKIIHDQFIEMNIDKDTNSFW